MSIVAALAVAAQMCSAQAGPPVCPAEPGSRPVSITPAKRPSTEEITAIAERGAADPSVLVADAPIPNFGVERYRLADYAECVGNEGCYWADLDAQTKRAEVALEHVVSTAKSGEKLAMVLDIDETSLSGFCEFRREDYGFLLGPWTKWALTPQAAMPIPGTVALFNKAKALRVDVFFITGRGEELTEATARNLELSGYKGWKGLALRRGPEKQMATVEYKSSERKKIVDDGYRIVMSVGDQWSDLDGTSRAEISVKLPNPFYYLP